MVGRLFVCIGGLLRCRYYYRLVSRVLVGSIKIKLVLLQLYRKGKKHLDILPPLSASQYMTREYDSYHSDECTYERE